jgi:glycerophosphoryl diester phosphodiesterase
MRIFGNKIILIIILAILLFFFIFNNIKPHISKNFEISKFIEKIFNEKTNKRYSLIAHAGGGIDNYTYTNSEEALNNSIKKGFSLIELDMIETSDNQLVAAHDWKLFRKISSCCKDEIPDLNEFNSSVILNKYTPLDTNKINEIFEKNKKLILVIDKTNNFDLINSSFTFDQSRIIVEIFGRDNYLRAIRKGIKNPLYSASIEHRDDEKNFINKYDIKMIAISSSDFIKNKKYFENLKNKKGTIIFLYTTNDHNFVDSSRDIIDAFYTDFIDINTMKCTSKVCKTY